MQFNSIQCNAIWCFLFKACWKGAFGSVQVLGWACWLWEIQISLLEDPHPLLEDRLSSILRWEEQSDDHFGGPFGPFQIGFPKFERIVKPDLERIPSSFPWFVWWHPQSFEPTDKFCHLDLEDVDFVNLLLVQKTCTLWKKGVFFYLEMQKIRAEFLLSNVFKGALAILIEVLVKFPVVARFIWSNLSPGHINKRKRQWQWTVSIDGFNTVDGGFKMFTSVSFCTIKIRYTSL